MAIGDDDRRNTRLSMRVVSIVHGTLHTRLIDVNVVMFFVIIRITVTLVCLSLPFVALVPPILFL
jgi:hypothetical protein